ncbi:M23 family metallopeptidase [Calderihabitans maritimus]|uniref:Peptidase M23B n=1 Tax=Calderihabitans maritimus TaxID=1246530 RepID=A0A1Z5HVF1_9FIRM|nr:M23 family metallopeptidase [Calderihabitans maritimus]GAW93327.1 peptidase M23B [Calderihabitans maritimus]
MKNNWGRGGRQKWRLNLFLSRRRLKRIAGTIIFFLIVFTIFGIEHPALKEFQRAVKFYLTSPAADWGPWFEQVASRKVWQDSFEEKVFQVMTSLNKDEDMIPVPVSGETVRAFGWVEVKGHPRFHQGIDIKTRVGVPVRAVLPGRVLKVDNHPAMGRRIEIMHENGLKTIYAGLGEILVGRGDRVKKGQIIAKTSWAEEKEFTNIHFEVRKNDRPIDPVILLIGTGAKI